MLPNSRLGVIRAAPGRIALRACRDVRGAMQHETRANGSAEETTSFCKCTSAAGSCRSSNSRWAVVRHQTSRSSSRATSSFVVALLSRGGLRAAIFSGTIRQMRPLSLPSSRPGGFFLPGGINCGCSITWRYMSTTYRAPSGPWVRKTGRHQSSGVARNSTPCRAGRPVKVAALRQQDFLMNEVAGRLAGEDAAAILGRQRGRRGKRRRRRPR